MALVSVYRSSSAKYVLGTKTFTLPTQDNGEKEKLFHRNTPRIITEYDFEKKSVSHDRRGIELSKGVNNRHLAGGQNHCLGLDGQHNSIEGWGREALFSPFEGG
ncbi:unnamed protein product, partial [Porites evermanni]